MNFYLSKIVSQCIFFSCFSINNELLDFFQAHGIDHLVIPTRDYLFAPSIVDINQAVQFIHSGCFLVNLILRKGG